MFLYYLIILVVVMFWVSEKCLETICIVIDIIQIKLNWLNWTQFAGPTLAVTWSNNFLYDIISLWHLCEGILADSSLRCYSSLRFLGVSLCIIEKQFCKPLCSLLEVFIWQPLRKNHTTYKIPYAIMNFNI